MSTSQKRAATVYLAASIWSAFLAGAVAITNPDPVARGVFVFLEACIGAWFGFRARIAIIAGEKGEAA